jgi:hypothetical protein
MATADEVTAELPGLHFSVRATQRYASLNGVHSGTILLHCTVSAEELFEAAVEKLDGYRMFSSCTEEIITALGMELDSLTGTLKRSQLLEAALRREIDKKDKEIDKMKEFLAQLERELGIDL